MQKIIFAFILLPYFIFSQNNPEYAATNIPPELLKNANAVVREHRIDFIVEAPGKATFKEFRAVTILNGKTDYDVMVVHYNPSNKLSRIDGRIYDRNGSLIRKINKKESKDVSAISSFSIYEDDRIRYLDVNHTDYPYTVEFEYEMSYKDLLNYPNWRINEFNVAVQEATYNITLPVDLKLHYKPFNIEAEPTISSLGSNQNYTWSLANILPVVQEPYCPSAIELLPSIIASPGTFEAENYTGSMSSWDAFGKFMNKLMVGRDELSPIMKNRVQELTADAKTDQEKVDILYRYMQENMRYVSVQLGIGGWQPFDAKYVETNKYGDCKALSNFMKALLKEAGIAAYPVLIYNGQKPFKITDDFTTPIFNHMILHVPSENYWLECTSTTYPPNYIGTSNSNRNVLLVTETGGKIGRTPKMRPTDNTENNFSTINLKEDGAAMVEFNSVRRGNRQDYYRYAKNNYSEVDLKKEISKNIPLPSFSLNDLSVEINADEPEGILKYLASVPRYASKAGTRLFIPLNAVNPYSSVPSADENRQHPIIVENGYTEQDSIVINIPVGFKVESMPAPENILENDFGKYSLKIIQDQYTVTIIRELTINSVNLPAEDYDDWRNFYKEVAKLDGSKMVVVNKT
ncbi:MAG: DUF3857 and transglutaminase domain-containing protein [Bacteroidota bacterium]